MVRNSSVFRQIPAGRAIGRALPARGDCSDFTAAVGNVTDEAGAAGSVGALDSVDVVLVAGDAAYRVGAPSLAAERERLRVLPVVALCDLLPVDVPAIRGRSIKRRHVYTNTAPSTRTA